MELMCRACLIIEEDFVLLDESFIINFNTLTNLELKLDEKSPLYTCKSCLNAVNCYIEFREKCIASDKTYRQMLLEKKITKKESNEEPIQTVKEEIKLEFDIIEDTGEPFCEEYTNELLEDIVLKSENKKSLTDELLPKRRSSRKCKKIKQQEVLQNQKKAKKENEFENINFLLSCGLCSKSFETKEQLSNHIEQHKGIKQCGLCSENFFSYSHALGHRVTHVPEKQKKCIFCDKRFVNANTLEFHYMHVHEMANKDERIKCKHCMKDFNSSRRLNKHVTDRHGLNNQKCEICSKGGMNKTQLRYHLKTHSLNKKVYKCDKCDFTTLVSSGFQNHKLKNHSTNEIYCKYCKRIFRDKECLEKHSCRRHKKVVCSICGLNVKTLTRHMLCHEDVYKFKCDRCPAKYKYRAAFTVHVDKHDGIKRHKCEYCEKAFHSPSVLHKHKRTHTGEKPYVCKICLKAFTGNNNLKVHMRIHGLDLIVKKNDAQELDNKK